MKKVVVEVCLGTSCHLLGAQDLMTYLERTPKEWKEWLEVRGSTCLHNCGKGPNVKINDVVYTGMTPDHLHDLLSDLLETAE